MERLQLEDTSRLLRALATYAVVAWRLLWLTCRARQDPEGACDAVITGSSRQILHRAVERSEPLGRAPGLRVAVHHLARLGGFLSRASDGEPGVTTLWRGLRRLENLTLGWTLAQQASRASSPTCGEGSANRWEGQPESELALGQETLGDGSSFGSEFRPPVMDRAPNEHDPWRGVRRGS